MRAKLRVKIKTLLKRYKYPPDAQQKAINTVLQQAETPWGKTWLHPIGLRLGLPHGKSRNLRESATNASDLLLLGAKSSHHIRLLENSCRFNMAGAVETSLYFVAG